MGCKDVCIRMYGCIYRGDVCAYMYIHTKCKHLKYKFMFTENTFDGNIQGCCSEKKMMFSCIYAWSYPLKKNSIGFLYWGSCAPAGLVRLLELAPIAGFDQVY